MQYRIINYTNGHYGYKTFYELQVYNTVYKKWNVIKESLELVFIESYCIMRKINFKIIDIIAVP
jgi:hypothetical protein